MCRTPPNGAVANPGNVYTGSYPEVAGSSPEATGSYPEATGSYPVAARTSGYTCGAKFRFPTDITGYNGATGSYMEADDGCIAATVGATWWLT